MRAALVHALNSSLAWDDQDHERAIDKVTAFSHADRLGTLLWRLKYDNDRSAFKPAYLLLARKLKINSGLAIKIARHALNEWLYQFCTACLGAKEIRSGDLVVTCNKCCGSGVRRWTNAERHRAIGANMDNHIKAVLDHIGTYDRHVSSVMRKKLG